MCGLTRRSLQSTVLRLKPGAEQAQDRLPFMLQRKVVLVRTRLSVEKEERGRGKVASKETEVSEDTSFLSCTFYMVSFPPSLLSPEVIS